MIQNSIVAIFTLLLLTACSMKSVREDDEDKSRIVRTAKINAELGIAYLEKHQVQIAKQKLLLALSQGPNLPETWYSMGYFYETTGNNAEAKKHYLKALQLTPEQGDVHNNYGTFLCRTGDYADAIKHFVLATQDKNYLYAGMS